MFFTLPNLLPLLLTLPHLIRADGASILQSISLISNASLTLNTTVSAFPSNPILGLGDIGPLLVDSVALLNDINEGTGVANESANLTSTEAIQIAEATIALASVVESTLQTIVDAKPKFDKLLIVSPTVLLNLKLEWEATDKFGAAIVSKVPIGLQSVAETLLVPIDDAFNSTVIVYEG